MISGKKLTPKLELSLARECLTSSEGQLFCSMQAFNSVNNLHTHERIQSVLSFTDLNINLPQKYLCRHIPNNLLVEYLHESTYHVELTIRVIANSGKCLPISFCQKKFFSRPLVNGQEDPIFFFYEKKKCIINNSNNSIMHYIVYICVYTHIVYTYTHIQQ